MHRSTKSGFEAMLTGASMDFVNESNSGPNESGQWALRGFYMHFVCFIIGYQLPDIPSY